jgi:hypothetical protein
MVNYLLELPAEHKQALMLAEPELDRDITAGVTLRP